MFTSTSLYDRYKSQKLNILQFPRFFFLNFLSFLTHNPKIWGQKGLYITTTLFFFSVHRNMEKRNIDETIKLIILPETISYALKIRMVFVTWSLQNGHLETAEEHLRQSTWPQGTIVISTSLLKQTRHIHAAFAVSASFAAMSPLSCNYTHNIENLSLETIRHKIVTVRLYINGQYQWHIINTQIITQYFFNDVGKKIAKSHQTKQKYFIMT